MSDYISKKGIQKDLIGLPADLDAKTVQRCIEAVHNFPAADVRENVHAHWVHWKNWGNRFVCSNCSKEMTASQIGLFCKECGAIMDGGKEK